ncbi:MAG: hypothetical protein WKF31_10295 [Thermoleophilaceae bacterium]
MTVASGAFSAIWPATSPTIDLLTSSRSSRLMPGLRGEPEVMITMSEPDASS